MTKNEIDMTNTLENTILELRAREGWYRLLAGVFAEEPKEVFLRELRENTCHSALIELGVKFDKDFLTPDFSELVEQLACEYTMLFVAPGGFPPVESVRLQGGYRQSAASRVKEFYTSEGVAVKASGFDIFDDHLAVEMGFVATLLERQANALEHNEEIESKRLEKSIKRFWVQHLGRWVRGFSTLVEQAAEHSFYREMSILLNAFSESELETLKLDIVDGDGGRWRAPKPAQVTQPMQCGGGA